MHWDFDRILVFHRIMLTMCMCRHSIKWRSYLFVVFAGKSVYLLHLWRWICSQLTRVRGEVSWRQETSRPWKTAAKQILCRVSFGLVHPVSPRYNWSDKATSNVVMIQFCCNLLAAWESKWWILNAINYSVHWSNMTNTFSRGHTSSCSLHIISSKLSPVHSFISPNQCISSFLVVEQNC